MRLCVFTNHFYPEDFKVNDIAFELAKKGNEITVVTAIPDYPQGKFHEGYSLLKRRKEKLNGIQVYRLPIIPRGKGKKIEMILNYASYFISVLLFTVIFLYKKSYDAVFVHLTSPFFIGLPAVLLKRKQQIPLLFWTLDLWPESLSAAGGINNKFILNTQMKFVRYVYDNCEKILIASQGFKKSICEKGDYNNKLIYFPNWAEDIQPTDASIDIKSIAPFSYFGEDDFIILFAGNIGEAQNIDALIEAAKLTKNNHKIKWVFLGDGRERSNMIVKTVDYNLHNTVFFPGRYPLHTMPTFMKKADILLVSLKDEPIFNLTVPSKVQFYMAQGKPILGMLNGDGSDIIKKAQCGYCVPAGDYSSLAEVIKDISENKNNLYLLGQNGRNYYNEYFRKDNRIKQLENIINQQ